MPGQLFIVATPIGNLNDMTARAIETLSSVDIIAAEDTRTSMVLLNHYGIKKKLISYHKFNESARAGGVVDELLAGASVAVITDAGTPCVSDPGSLLVKRAVEAGIEVVPICGASAVVAALSISGFPSLSFAFYGFLPKKKAEITRLLEDISEDHAGIAVFYESPRRIMESMSIINQIFPSSDICLCNDLTKKFERIYRGSAEGILDQLASNPSSDKGEYTIVLDKGETSGKRLTDGDTPCIEAMLVDLMVKHGCTLKEASYHLLNEKKGELSRKSVYSASLRLKEILYTGVDRSKSEHQDLELLAHATGKEESEIDE